MGADVPRIDRIAEQISDGTPVDWNEIESTGGGEDRRVLENLRLIESLSDAIRSPKDVSLRLSSAALTSAPTLADATIEKALGEDDTPSWGPFKLLQKVGEGAFGDVYRALDTHLDCHVALKLLRESESAMESVASEVIREGRLMARVQHPNIVAVRGADRHDGRVGIWMEFVEGRTLEEILRDGQLHGAAQAAGIGMDLCRALAAVHNAELLHSDIKAQNVMLHRDGRILLMDFSAGRDLRLEETTGQRTVSGTPLYMAPEILLSRQPSKRSDIYSMGVLLYHLVTGGYPITAGTMKELRQAHRDRRMRLLGDERPDLDPRFIEVVEKALAWDPAGRYQTAGEMEQALRAVSLGASSSERRPVGLTPAAPEVPAAGVAPEAVRKPSQGTWRWIAAVACGIVAVAVAAWMLRPGVPDDGGVPPGSTPPEATAAGSPRDGSGLQPSGAGGPSAIAPVAAVPAPAGLSCDASLVRKNLTGYAPLRDGSSIRIGDAVSMEVQCSDEVYAYVINEDERGEAYLLFPLKASGLTNPLPAGRKSLVPGRLKGYEDDPDQHLDWIATSEGGREHFLILMSRERLPELEADLDLVPEPRFLAGGRPADGSIATPPPTVSERAQGIQYAQISEDSRNRLRAVFRGIHLRGMGGVGTGGSSPSGEVSPDAGDSRPAGGNTLFRIYDHYARPHEAGENDIWTRHVVLENPVTGQSTGS